jgi:DNA-binding transcriptional regulator YiaG
MTTNEKRETGDAIADAATATAKPSGNQAKAAQALFADAAVAMALAGGEFRRLREDIGATIGVLAADLSVPAETVTLWEIRKETPVPADAALALCRLRRLHDGLVDAVSRAAWIALGTRIPRNGSASPSKASPEDAPLRDVLDVPETSPSFLAPKDLGSIGGRIPECIYNAAMRRLETRLAARGVRLRYVPGEQDEPWVDGRDGADTGLAATQHRMTMAARREAAGVWLGALVPLLAEIGVTVPQHASD